LPRHFPGRFSPGRLWPGFVVLPIIAQFLSFEETLKLRDGCLNLCPNLDETLRLA
jgi:hypothetical protein